MTIANPDNIGLSFSGDEAQKELVVAALRAYLADFYAPVMDKKGGGFMIGVQECGNCGRKLDGFFGTFTWGLAHGEGFCANCHWPCRGCHYIKIDGIKDCELKLGRPDAPFVLQYAEHCLKPESVQKLRKHREAPCLTT